MKEQRKKWKFKEINPERYKYFQESGLFPPFISGFLASRGFDSISQACNFLFPRIEDFVNPFSLKRCDPLSVAKRIEKAIKNKEKIALYGDTDADGIIGTFVLYHFLKNFFEEIEIVFPDREEEGYGFHEAYLPRLKEKGISLIITVDVGISAKKTVNLAKSLGIDVIITDHHEVPENLPDTFIVSGKLESPSSPVYHLCGAGVVFLLIRALRSYLYHRGFFTHQVPQIRKYLELVALATLADMVPLTGENRVITYIGFRDLFYPSFPALSFLFDMLGVKGNLTEEDLYYKVIPRINAGGRMGNPRLIFNFLNSSSYEEAEQYFKEIENLNASRQTLEKEIFNSLRMDIDFSEKGKFLLLNGENIPKGVLGLIANRFKEEFQVPVIVISSRNGVYFGSARSPKGINFLAILKQLKDLFIELGGHKHAFGFKIKKENLFRLKEGLEKIFKKGEIPIEEEILEIDGRAEFKEILSKEGRDILLNLPPFGENYEAPLFLFEDFHVKEFKILKEKHTRLILEKETSQIQAIIFNELLMKDRLKEVKKIVATPYFNFFSQKHELKIKDVE